MCCYVCQYMTGQHVRSHALVSKYCMDLTRRFDVNSSIHLLVKCHSQSNSRVIKYRSFGTHVGVSYSCTWYPLTKSSGHSTKQNRNPLTAILRLVCIICNVHLWTCSGSRHAHQVLFEQHLVASVWLFMHAKHKHTPYPLVAVVRHNVIINQSWEEGEAFALEKENVDLTTARRRSPVVLKFIYLCVVVFLLKEEKKAKIENIMCDHSQQTGPENHREQEIRSIEEGRRFRTCTRYPWHQYKMH